MDHPDCEVDCIKASQKGAKDDHCILTHVPTQTKRHFNRHGNHCIWHPTKEEASPATQFVETVKENMSKFSHHRQINGATKVRNLLKSLMLPSVRDLKKIIQFNLIKNNPCTLEDVRVAEHIWGPEIEPHAAKGKGNRRKPIPQSQDIVSIPPEVKRVHRDTHLCVDVTWVNGLPFLTSISANIMFRTATFIGDRKASTLFKHSDEILHHHNRAGYRITVQADFLTKPLQGETFKKMFKWLMGIE